MTPAQMNRPRMSGILLAFIAAPFLLFRIAAAQDFTPTEVENFLDTFESVTAIEAQTPQLNEAMNKFETDVTFLLDDDDNLALFNNLIALMEAYPDEKQIIQDTVMESGFYSLNHWADVGDLIMGAYMVGEVKASDVELLLSMEPLLAEMESTEKADLLPVIRLAKAIKKVPAENVAVFAPYRERFSSELDD